MNSLISESSGRLIIQKQNPSDKVIALAGNPNVGKSTVFNALTGLRQHTGNWPGKTVTNAQGYYSHHGQGYVLVDLPGCYSLMAHSAEEETARDFICFDHPDAVIVVCDATCLERNLNLVLQTIEITPYVVVCINLMDEAAKKGLLLNLNALEQMLGVPVVGTTARSKKGLNQLMETVRSLFEAPPPSPVLPEYPPLISEGVSRLLPALQELDLGSVSTSWMALKLLEQDASLLASAKACLGFSPADQEPLRLLAEEIRSDLDEQGLPPGQVRDTIAETLVRTAERCCRDIITYQKENYNERDRRYDRILTNKWTGFPVMLLSLLLIFWLTICGANYPSQLISTFLSWVEGLLMNLFTFIGMPELLRNVLLLGIFRVVSWVVAVMLPPMAIFFPLFTLLEDAGYLPRIAFNLDRIYKKCCACGKQALTMCMGFEPLQPKTLWQLFSIVLKPFRML